MAVAMHPALKRAEETYQNARLRQAFTLRALQKSDLEILDEGRLLRELDNIEEDIVNAEEEMDRLIAKGY